MREAKPIKKSEELQSLFDECKSINHKLHESIIELLTYSKEICDECEEEVIVLEDLEEQISNGKVATNDRNPSQAQQKN